ncbi:fibronectin type III domain-containing protein [candidate division KSB1 bacterium]|nr:fibronectin type III domain-containing protein [candidate division KSB1 bacterium]
MPRLLRLFAWWMAVTASIALAQDILVTAQGPAPRDVAIADVPNDDGTSMVVTWQPSPLPGFQIFGYEVRLSENDRDGFVVVGAAPALARDLTVSSGENFRISHRGQYFAQVVALDSTLVAVPDSFRADSVVYRTAKRLRRSESPVSAMFRPQVSWFNTNRVNILLMILVFFALVLYWVKRAKRGETLKFRRLAGIDAIDEAIGRATELGKPVLYVPGTQNIENIQTIASIQLLTSVASKCANYDTPIIVPLNRAFMVGVAEEAVKQGYLNAARPDSYNRDNIRYLSDEQFAFTSGVAGIMMREKTAAHLYLGAFFAESLILSETGFASGSIQIAGTANVHQLPFFVVACDYTLIGEEYFAASALVTQNADMLGTVKATDWFKLGLIVLLVAAMILELFGVHVIASWFSVS